MGGILHPEMKVENGTWDKPMATIGAKPDQPWTTTSVAAGVDSKPEPGTADHARGRNRGFLVLHPTGQAWRKASCVRAEMRE